jgi:hypothetical protein
MLIFLLNLLSSISTSTHYPLVGGLVMNSFSVNKTTGWSLEVQESKTIHHYLLILSNI